MNKTYTKLDIFKVQQNIHVYDKARKCICNVKSIDWVNKRVEFFINPFMSTTKDFNDVEFVKPIKKD